MNKTLKVPKTLHRGGSFTMDPETKTMRLSISSNEPYERYDWMNDERYLEVLDHSPGGPDLSRVKNGAALLYNHDRNIMLGTLCNPTLENGRCYVDAKLSNAPDVESYRIKVEEGILKDTSIGYTICDEGTKIGERDGIPIYKFRFAVHEASLVSIPADPTVGVGRQRDDSAQEFQEITVNVKNPVDTNSKQNHNHRNQATFMPDEPIEQPTAPKIEVSAVRNEAVQAERKRVAEIQDLVRHFRETGCMGRKVETSEIAAKAIADGRSVRDFQDEVVRSNPPEYKPVNFTPEIGMNEKERKQFSFCKAIRDLGTRNGLQGLEREASDAHAKLIGKEVGGCGFFIPQDVMNARAFPVMTEKTRALFTNVYSGAGAFVGTDLLGGSLIELLRNQMKVVSLGARMLSGLSGSNVAIPRQTGGATASWLAEDSTASATQQVVGQLNLTPHKLMAVTAYTEQLLMQSSVDVENFVRQDLMAVIAIARDLSALHGTGVSGQPAGITGTAGVPTISFASAESLTYAKAIALETTVAQGNALTGNLAYLTTPQARANAKQLAQLTTGNAIPVWSQTQNDGSGIVNGYRAEVSNQVSTTSPLGGVIFGNWNDLILADWSDTAVLVDPYSLSLQSQIRVNMRLYCDNGVRHTASFAYAST